MRDTKSLVIKILLTLFLAAFLIFLCTRDRAKDVPVEKIAEGMKSSSVSEMPGREKGDLKRYYSIQDFDTEGFVFYKDVSPMSVNEFLVVKAATKDKAIEFSEACESHMDAQKSVFASYGTDQMALLGKAYVGSLGNYAYYICGPDAAKWYKSLMDIIK